MKVPTEFLFWFVSGNIMQCVILDFIYSIISFVFNLILHDIIKGMVQPNQNTKDYGKPFWLLFILRIWILDINNYISISNNCNFWYQQLHFHL